MLWVNFLHFYQPPTQKKYWVDKITEESYRKIVDHLLQNENAKLTLNVSAVLCELWDTYGHHDVINKIRTLLERGQIELTGSAKYHPLLPKLPDSEIKRQIYLNELSLYKYFGIEGPILSKKYQDGGQISLKGFFPPEMAYSSHLARIVGELGYRWILAEELSYAYEFGKIDFSRLYKVKGTDLIIFFRDRYSSFKVLSGQLATSKLFLEEFKEKGTSGKYFLTAMDGETFGHHRPGLDKTLAEIYRDKSIDPKKISELLELPFEICEVETLPATWALMEIDITSGVPFARWDDPDNIIHKMQWDLTYLAIECVNRSSFSGLKDEELSKLSEFEVEKYKKARNLLDRSLHSDQFWWASAKPWWSLEMIERGAKELSDVVDTAPDSTEKDKEKARKFYFDIITTGFEWQRTGKVDETSRKYDEEIKMVVHKDLSKYSKKDVLEMVDRLTKEMNELSGNLEFERATQLRNRIKELLVFIDKNYAD